MDNLCLADTNNYEETIGRFCGSVLVLCSKCRGANNCYNTDHKH